MNPKTLRVLEFDKVLAMLAGFARSQLGKQECLAVQPMSDIAVVQYLQQLTLEAEGYIYANGAGPVGSFDDITAPLQKARVGSALSPGQLMAVARLAMHIRQTRDALAGEAEGERLIRQIAQGMTPMRELEREIDRCIISEEELADDASPQLYELRRDIRRAQEKIVEKLQAYIHSPQLMKYLQEPIITLRADRYVLPVKQEYRQQVPGMVHDQSSSGATVFIEPSAVVEINNKLRVLEAQQRDEIERILYQLTAMVDQQADTLQSGQQILAQLDCIFAKGCLSKHMRAIAPKINPDRQIRICRGRHPLIDPERVVPIDFWLGQGFTALVITGPNTGGKTVTLKSVGLFVLMAQAGMHVPADIGTELPVFEQVFADIGDEQSIEQSLSTFSSHMTNLVSILEQADAQSLVLLDELGAGTDPAEGAALAMAVLDHMRQGDIRSLATTHYSELKAYAMTQPGMQNASVEFDIQTLRPTYRLSIGMPGKSNAFEISRRLGLSEQIIVQAKGYLEKDIIRFEDVLEKAQWMQKQAQEQLDHAQKDRQKAQQLYEGLLESSRDQQDKREAQLQKAREQAKRIVENARAEADEVLREIRQIARELPAKEALRQAQQENEKLKKRENALQEKKQIKRAGPSVPLEEITIGDEMYLPEHQAQVTVLSRPNEHGEVQVQAGVLKMNVPIHALERLNHKKERQASTRAREIKVKNQNVSMSLDLRGLMLEEALVQADQYLDQAFLASLGEVTIIHGKGTGVLRNGIAELLRDHAHVKSFRPGKFGEGDTGVTVVQLQ